ncbi:U4/U6 small nuclear ribonucleoprotein Prp3 [Trichinella zimbabwensis]|uniref:U4/U6 small nuclear ribonucleoprotein Prp3 n=1 Tax=Trichinella zimbabwensis TaxID=268475 RepID=A0A0V1HQ63_9BILA|nr:U4/U6 small nuclear ribonucleoprotein Prp3 [Trichinella zimbabwensis]
MKRVDDKCSINSKFHTPINCLHFKKDLMPSVFEQRNVNVVTENVKFSHNTAFISKGEAQRFVIQLEASIPIEQKRDRETTTRRRRRSWGMHPHRFDSTSKIVANHSTHPDDLLLTTNCGNCSTLSGGDVHEQHAQSWQIWAIGLAFVTLISSCAVVGIVLLPLIGARRYKKILNWCIGLGVGSLSGSAVFNLIPSAFEIDATTGQTPLLLWTLLAGIYAFYLVDNGIKMISERRKKDNNSSVRVLNVKPVTSEIMGSGVSLTSIDEGKVSMGGVYTSNCSLVQVKPYPNQSSSPQHTYFDYGKELLSVASGLCSHDHPISIGQKRQISSIAWMVIFGDAIHNFIDGLSIGAAFAYNLFDGISVSIAVFCEEFPHELALTCYLGFVIGVILGEIPNASMYIYSLAGGMFLFISLANMLPDMNKKVEEKLKHDFMSGLKLFFIQFSGIVFGLLCMFTLAMMPESEPKEAAKTILKKAIGTTHSKLTHALTKAIDRGYDKTKMKQKLLEVHSEEEDVEKILNAVFAESSQLSRPSGRKSRFDHVDDEKSTEIKTSNNSDSASSATAKPAVENSKVQEIMLKAQRMIEERKKVLQVNSFPYVVNFEYENSLNSRICQLQPSKIAPDQAKEFMNASLLRVNRMAELRQSIASKLPALMNYQSVARQPGKPTPLILDSEGRTVDTDGRAVQLIQRQPTLKANIRAEKVALFNKAVQETAQATDDRITENATFFDKRVKVKGPGRARREFSFKEDGEYVKQANRLRAKCRLERLQQEISLASKKTGISSAVKLAMVVPRVAESVEAEVPNVEWWDSVILPGETYDVDLDSLNFDIITNLIEHPVQLKPPGEHSDRNCLKVYLTKKEQKKLRRQNRRETQREKTEKIRLGLEPPPEPKVKISNLMRVLESQAIQDPTKMEAHVREQMAKRLKKHEEANLARKLTHEQRIMKRAKKISDDLSTGVQVAVYRVLDLSDPAKKFKVEMNAKQIHMTGTVVLHKDINVIVVEGGPKQQRFFKRLMMHRIKWEDQQIPGTSKKQSPPNRCFLIWEGIVKKKAFGEIKFKMCPLEKLAREYFQKHGVEYYWDMAYSRAIMEQNDAESTTSEINLKHVLTFRSKEHFLNMPLAEKRNLYACGNNFVTLENVPTVDKMFHCNQNVEFAKKFSLWQGDITSLEVNAIVNAANSALRVGGGVDGAIHRAAGKELSEETYTLGGCPPGFAKITAGYRLPAKYVIHTVGPTDGNPETLKSCYENCFDICSKKGLNSIAFPCVGTGIYGFPNDKACEIAVTTALEWLKTAENMKTFCIE